MTTACKNLNPHKHDAKIGCSKAAHYALGWCSGSCSAHTIAEETVAWRMLHAEQDHEHGNGSDFECPQHELIQHRDGKPPWCRRCGRDKDGHIIGKVRSWTKP